MQSLALLPIGRTATTATAERTSVAAARQLPDLAGAGGRGGAARAVSSPSPHRPPAAPSRTRSRATPPPCTVHGPPPGRSPGALAVLPPPQPPACERPVHGLPSPPHPHEHSPRPLLRQLHGKLSSHASPCPRLCAMPPTRPGRSVDFHPGGMVHHVSHLA
jgi:hypothetical protein